MIIKEIALVDKKQSNSHSNTPKNNNNKDDSSNINMLDSMYFGNKSYRDDISEMHNNLYEISTVRSKRISPIWKKRFLSII